MHSALQDDQTDTKHDDRISTLRKRVIFFFFFALTLKQDIHIQNVSRNKMILKMVQGIR